jgi:hypothetical protein
MKRVYCSPEIKTHPMHVATCLCTSCATGTPFGVDNTAKDNLIIS